MPAVRDVAPALLDHLSRGLAGTGWRVERDLGLPNGVRADLVLHKGSRHYLVGIKIAREARRSEVEAQLANAMLQSRAYARPNGYLALGVVGAPSISDALAAHLQDYGRRFGEGQAFGFVDGRGRMELFGEGLEGIAAPQGPPVGRAVPGARAQDLFSGSNQWLLKVLLAQKLPANLLHAPRGVIENASDLAKMADVSLPTASRLVRGLERDGYLERGWRCLSLVRIEHLLDRWRSANRRSPVELKAKFLLAKGRPEDQLRESLARWDKTGRPRGETAKLREADGAPQAQPTACLGLFAACSWLGIGLVQGAPSHLYVENVGSQVLDGFGLREVEAGEQADVILRVARWPRSIFRAAPRVDPLPVSDIVQIWLDTIDHPLRGQKQAESIWNSYLAPMLLKGQGAR